MAAVSMSKRTFALVAAVVLAAVATFALISYVQGARDEVEQKESPVEVFVAKQTIPQGVAGDAVIGQALLVRETVPAKLRPADAITSLEQIKGRVAAFNIQARETILLSKFVAPGQVGAGLPIPANRHAISVEVDIPPGVAGFIRQGDHVSLIAHMAVKSLEDASGRATPIRIGNQRILQGDVAKYIVQNVEVLAVGQRIVTTTEEGSQQAQAQQSTSKVLVTLAVTPADAEKIVFATLGGNVYFVIVPRDSRPVTTTGRTIFNEFGR